MLKNKTILILSPQSWGKMFVSKHHYAVELARYGNRVFFLDPPDNSSGIKKDILIESSNIHPGLSLVRHRLWFPYNLKFHVPGLFHLLMKGHIKKILNALGTHPDIVWSFDLGNLYPLKYFPEKSFKIFHPVDEPRTQTALDAAKGAQIIFSVTREIIEKYRFQGIPANLVNHGVQEIFFSKGNSVRNGSADIRIGISGNLLRSDIDRTVLLNIVRSNKNCVFEFWGSFQSDGNNIGGSTDSETVEFISDLRSEDNVVLHGPVRTEELAGGFGRMDAFLICYDVNKDQSKGTNYHKVMEYLATGKVIISNNISSYQGRPDLVQMIAERDSNVHLPALFSKIVNDLSSFNNLETMARRISFAAANTYARKIEEIDHILDSEVVI
jgi:hypothetical protein